RLKSHSGGDITWMSPVQARFGISKLQSSLMLDWIALLPTGPDRKSVGVNASLMACRVGRGAWPSNTNRPRAVRGGWSSTRTSVSDTGADAGTVTGAVPKPDRPNA